MLHTRYIKGDKGVFKNQMIQIHNMNCGKQNKHFFHRARATGRSTKERGNKGECNQADGLVWRILCRERWESCVTGVKLCLRYPTEARRHHRFQKVILVPSIPLPPLSHPLHPLGQESTSLKSSTQTKAEIICSCVCFTFYIFPGSEERINVHQDA